MTLENSAATPADRPAGNRRKTRDRTPADSSVQSNFAEFHEAYVRHYVALADTKATVFFGLISTLIAYLFARPYFHDLIFSPVAFWPSALAYIAALLLGISGICCILVLAPRLWHGGEGLVFFGAVAKFKSGNEYVRAVTAETEAGITISRLKHTYDVSRVCTRKYSLLRASIWLGLVGIGASLPLLGHGDSASSRGEPTHLPERPPTAA